MVNYQILNLTILNVAFDVTNKEIADLFNVQYQTTLLILEIIKKSIEALVKQLKILFTKL